MNKSRHDHIKSQLAYLQSNGVITDWMLYSPDGNKRWVLSGPGLNISLSTHEVEIWLSGAATVNRKEEFDLLDDFGFR